jgi:hypothetical protein
MDKFLVEFPSLFSNLEEQWEKELSQEKKENLGLDQEETFANERDYVGRAVIDMMQISGFEEGLVWINGEETSCIFAEYDHKHNNGTDFTRNFLVPYEDFKAIWEYANELKVEKASELIKQIKENANNTKSSSM